MIDLLNTKEIERWISNFDALHISFDIDCLDPSIIKSVNTPVKNGLTLNNVKEAFTIIKNSNKLISMDLVEYNPLKDTSEEDLNIIINLMKYLYF
jgi:arginase